jgi:hypothetical protein
VAIDVDEHVVDAATLGHGALHLDHPTHPVVVIRAGDAEEPSWIRLAGMAEHLVALIGFPAASDTLRAAALTLDRSLGGAWKAPSADDVADAFRISEERVREIWLSVGGHVDRLLRFITVEVAWRLGTIAATGVSDADPTSVTELLEELGGVLAEGVEASEVIDRAERSSTFGDLREQLHAELGPFNGVLRELGLPPVHFTDRHRSALRHYIEQRRGEIVDRLREGYLDVFRAIEDLSGYTTVRGLEQRGRHPWI